MQIKIHPSDNPPGKLADVELHFITGPLAGLKLIGFGVWERRTGGGRNVTFPARQYAVNGERRSFALLRPIVDTGAQEAIRAAILDAYQQHDDANRPPARCGSCGAQAGEPTTREPWTCPDCLDRGADLDTKPGRLAL